MVTRLGFLASGEGTNFQAIIDHLKLGILSGCKAEVLISNVKGAGVVKRGEKEGIRVEVIPYETREVFERKANSILEEEEVDLLLLAGFNRILSKEFVEHWKGKCLNIHPSLLPSFGGLGYYGLRVHEEVLNSRCLVSGCTVHYVTEDVDMGPILTQAALKTFDSDPRTLQRKINLLEHLTYPKAIQMHVDGLVSIEEIRNREEVSEWENVWEERQEEYLEKRRDEWERVWGEKLEVVLCKYVIR